MKKLPLLSLFSIYFSVYSVNNYFFSSQTEAAAPPKHPPENIETACSLQKHMRRKLKPTEWKHVSSLSARKEKPKWKQTSASQIQNNLYLKSGENKKKPLDSEESRVNLMAEDEGFDSRLLHSVPISSYNSNGIREKIRENPANPHPQMPRPNSRCHHKFAEIFGEFFFILNPEKLAE